MEKDFHPLNHIQIAEDLCKILNEDLIDRVFDMLQQSKLGDGGCEGHLYFFPFLVLHLQELSLKPLT